MAGSRKFGGKIYWLATAVEGKRKAQKAAKKWRKNGVLVRVTPAGKGFPNVYEIWTRSAKGYRF